MATAPRPPPREHLWFTPAQIAAILDGHKHGDHYRAKCPAHGGDNPTSLKISEGHDDQGFLRTRLYCFAHQCTTKEICAAMGMPVRNLYAQTPQYRETMKHFPRAHSPRAERLRHYPEPSPDDIAQIMLEEMLVSDPEWIQTCEPARQKMWELAQADPQSKAALTNALRLAGFIPAEFWQQLKSDIAS